MNDSGARAQVGNNVTRLLIALLVSIAAGWAMLILGGRTDAAGRMGLALGAAVFALVSIGWGREPRAWLRGLAVAGVLGGARPVVALAAY